MTGIESCSCQPGIFSLEIEETDFHEHFIKQKFQETEISCTKSEMSRESHGEENAFLDYGNKC